MSQKLALYSKLVSDPTVPNIGELLDMLLDEFMAERGCFWLESQGAVIYRGDEELKMTYPFSRQVVGAAVKTRLGLVSFDVMEDDRIAPTESVKTTQIRSCLCVPARDEKGKILAVIYFDTKTSRSFSQENLDFLIELMAFYPGAASAS